MMTALQSFTIAAIPDGLMCRSDPMRERRETVVAGGTADVRRRKIGNAIVVNG